MTPTELDLCQQCFERWPELRPTRPAIIGPRKYTLQRSGSGWSWVCGAASVPTPNRDAYNACRVALEDECLRREMYIKTTPHNVCVFRVFGVDVQGPTVLEACARALLGDGG